MQFRKRSAIWTSAASLRLDRCLQHLKDDLARMAVRLGVKLVRRAFPIVPLPIDGLLGPPSLRTTQNAIDVPSIRSAWSHQNLWFKWV